MEKIEQTEKTKPYGTFEEYLQYWGFTPLICCDGCSWRRECFEIESSSPCREYKDLCGYGEEKPTNSRCKNCEYFDQGLAECSLGLTGENDCDCYIQLDTGEER